MYSLNLPLIQPRGGGVISQHVRGSGLTWHMTVLGGNGDDAFRFWATCSTGTTAVTSGWLDQNCRKKSTSSFLQPRGRRVGRIFLSRPLPGRNG